MALIRQQALSRFLGEHYYTLRFTYGMGRPSVVCNVNAAYTQRAELFGSCKGTRKVRVKILEKNQMGSR